MLGWHLTNNHPLPDGNKRTAFIAMVVFIKLNGRTWTPPGQDDAVNTMLAVAGKNLDIDGLATRTVPTAATRRWETRHRDNHDDSAAAGVR